jgi:hypothetical protein
LIRRIIGPAFAGPPVHDLLAADGRVRARVSAASSDDDQENVRPDARGDEADHLAERKFRSSFSPPQGRFFVRQSFQ